MRCKWSDWQEKRDHTTEGSRFSQDDCICAQRS